MGTANLHSCMTMWPYCIAATRVCSPCTSAHTGASQRRSGFIEGLGSFSPKVPTRCDLQNGAHKRHQESKNCGERKPPLGRLRAYCFGMLTRLSFGMQLAKGDDVFGSPVRHFGFEILPVSEKEQAFQPNEKGSNKNGLKQRIKQSWSALLPDVMTSKLRDPSRNVKSQRSLKDDFGRERAWNHRGGNVMQTPEEGKA